jgi:hypothetical protein
MLGTLSPLESVHRADAVQLNPYARKARMHFAIAQLKRRHEVTGSKIARTSLP